MRCVEEFKGCRPARCLFTLCDAFYYSSVIPRRRLLKRLKVRVSNSFYHVGVGIPGVFKQLVPQFCILKTHCKLSCGTSAVRLFVSHVLLAVGKLNVSDQTECRIYMKIGEGVLYKLVVVLE